MGKKQKTITIPYNSLSDLFRRFEVIKTAHVLCYKQYKQKLAELNIKFKEIDEQLLSIDTAGLSEEQMNVACKKDTSIIQDVYTQLGVTENY